MPVDDLIRAAKEGDVSTVKKMIRSDPALGAMRTASGESAVMAALYRGHRDCVDAMVAAGTPLDIFSAAALGDTAAIESMLAAPDVVNAYAYDGWTPLHLAAFFGHRDAVVRLLQAGASIN